MTAAPIAPVQAVSLADATSAAVAQTDRTAQAGTMSFSQMLLDGIDRINQKSLSADALVRAFVLDDSIPVHQVTYALAQVQGSLEMALQIRARLLDGYQQLMNMQL
jgi:flagellar hook-basal body complex protein FliE